MKNVLDRLIFYCAILSQVICQETARINISVTVPAGTDQVILIGNIETLGIWDHSKALSLARVDSNRFSGNFQVVANSSIEYKLTRGSWDAEALTDGGRIPGNTEITVQGDTTIHHKVTAWRNDSFHSGAGITGEVRYHRDFYSPQLDNRREIIIWLPPSYSSENSKYYPVLYAHEGQNIFTSGNSLSGEEWGLDETATGLIEAGEIEEILIVGIANTADRTAEYSPVLIGNLYSDFLIHTVKPFIDANYRTRPGPDNTATIGSSLGGLIAFDLVWEHPDIFSMAGCLSPAFMVDGNEIVKRVKKYRGLSRQVKLYIDNGTEELEQRLQPAIDNMIPLLEEKGLRTPENYLYFIAEGGFHNEKAWSARVHRPLIYFFGSED